MKKILISGGAGYLGVVLTKFLLKNYIIIVFDEFNFKWLEKNKNKVNFSERLFFIKKSIFDVKIEDFKDVEVVCDLNGLSNDPSSEINKAHTWKVNFYGRKKFAYLAKKAGVKKYIFNSTCAVYGFNDKVVDENSRTNPISVYAKANLRAEKEIYKLRSKKFTVNILRNSTLYGYSPSLRLDLVVHSFIYDYYKKSKIYINGDGNQYRPLISIFDVCKIYKKIIKNSFPSFTCNLVNFNIKIKDLAELICTNLKLSKKIIVFKKNNNDLRNYRVNSIVFKKYFNKIDSSNFSKDLKDLLYNFNKNKIKRGTENIRMLFYKKKFLKKNKSNE